MRSARMQSTLRKLRPAKVRSATRRRLFEYELEGPPLRDAPGVVRLGSWPGGWMIPSDLVGPSWLCYCGGIGGDISFDLALISRYGATVRAFDPVAGYVEDAIEKANAEPRFSAYQAAIAVADGPLRMQLTHQEDSRSVSGADLYDSKTYVELPGRSLPSLMAELGDTQIDLLKLDVEGAEYELIPTLDLRALGVKIFSTQLHHSGSVDEARGLIARLGREGYEPVGSKAAVKLTFARTDLLE
jgi:FkbM family methyltransferase